MASWDSGSSGYGTDNFDNYINGTDNCSNSSTDGDTNNDTDKDSDSGPENDANDINGNGSGTGASRISIKSQRISFTLS